MKKLLLVAVILIYPVIPLSHIKASTPIKILLVPGHDDEVWGAQYGNTKEADMNLNLATRIYSILKKDKRFEVHITRNSKGYAKEFTDYFSVHGEDISVFKENAKALMKDKITGGSFVKKINPPHHAVSEDVAIRLYGFNKWANENKIDAMLHIHFNDYPRPSKWMIGKYKGFAIYIPEDQMANSKKSVQLALKIFTQLRTKYLTSTYEKEKGGLIPDQTLIALGSNGTLSGGVRSVLVEYGYIYEKKLRTSSARLKSYKNMANLTTTGIKNYFFRKDGP